jgi:periplasmic divalent cation tolerance protein
MSESSPSAELWIILTTVASQEDGIQLGRRLVEEGWVACAQVLPAMQSVYGWQGSLCEEVEHLLLLKVPAHLYAAAEQRIQKLHPYQEPEIIALTAASVSQSYLAWVLKQTRDPEDTTQDP